MRSALQPNRVRASCRADVVVRISIDRIAGRTLPEDREKMLNFLDGHIHPFVADRGFEWELHIDETSPDACEIQTGDSVV